MDTIRIRWQYCLDGNDITGQMYAETDADEVRAWQGAHGDTCVLAVKRTPRGRWAIDTSDTFRIPRYRLGARYVSPADALNQIASMSKRQVADAVCRCGTADECD